MAKAQGRKPSDLALCNVAFRFQDCESGSAIQPPAKFPQPLGLPGATRKILSPNLNRKEMSVSYLRLKIPSQISAHSQHLLPSSPTPQIPALYGC